MRKRSWSSEQLERAVRDSTTYRQVLCHLNIRPAGGHYGQLRKYIRDTGLDTTHFTGQGWSRGKKYPRPQMHTLAEIMTDDSDYQSHDQLVPFLVLARGRSELAVSRVTRHLLTNLWTASRLLPVRFEVRGEEGAPGTVTIEAPG